MATRRPVHAGSVGAHPRRALAPNPSLSLALLVAPLAATPVALDDPSPVGPPMEPGVGTVVALLEHEWSGPEPFVLRGTVPVPPGIYPREDGRSPFLVRGGDGQLQRAQTESVSFYAKDSDGADVVEVLARVSAGPQPADGRVGYEVVYYPHSTAPHPGKADPTDLALGPEVPGSVVSLLSVPGQLQLFAEDVFGNPYVCDLFEGAGGMELTRYGQAVAELRTYGVMRPVAEVPGPKGTLPHLFGVHAYLRTYDGDELIGLDLRIHNGFDGHDAESALDDPLGDVYFRRIDLILPSYWELHYNVTDPAAGKPKEIGNSVVWPLVNPLGSGDPHLMPHQGQFHRRLAIAAPSMDVRAERILEQRDLAFAQPAPLGGPMRWSWWNPITARYFAIKHRLPRLAHVDKDLMRAELANQFDLYNSMMMQGNGLGLYPVVSGALGWSHPWGVPYGGMAGGAEIVFFDGIETAVSASTEGFRLAELVHRMHTERQPNALYHGDGYPTGPAHWLLEGQKGPFLPMNFYMGLLPGSNDPFGFEDAPTFQVDYVQDHGLQPWYEDAMKNFAPHDLQHLTRYTRSAKVLAWLGNDSVAKDDLRMQADLVRLTYHPWASSWGGYVLDASMKADIDWVAAHPGEGVSVGRAEGWAVDTVATVYAFSSPEWREEVRPWFDQFSKVLMVGQATCTGFLQSHVSKKFFNYKYKARASIEQAILESAIREMVETVYRGVAPEMVDGLEGVLHRSVRAGVSPMAWSFQLGGPNTVTALGLPGEEDPLWCSADQIPEDGRTDLIDNYQPWSSFSYAWQLTHDPLFLFRAQQLIGGELVTMLALDGTKNLGTRAALVALVEEIAGGK